MIIRSDINNYEWFATPDKVHVCFEDGNGKISANHKDIDSIPFVIIQNKIIAGKPKQTHNDLYDAEYCDMVELRGRLWTSKKIIVSWEEMFSYQAKQIVEYFSKYPRLDVSNYLYLQDMSFVNRNQNGVYAISMNELISIDACGSDLPELYNQQEAKNKKDDEEDEVTAQFGYNGVSGRLGKYLTTTWGDSVEHCGKTVILTEGQLDNFRKKNKK